MHSFPIEKFEIDLIENESLNYYRPLYYFEMLLQLLLFGTYNIDKSSFEHQIYDIEP
jgi:hypothetical protein